MFYIASFQNEIWNFEIVCTVELLHLPITVLIKCDKAGVIIELDVIKLYYADTIKIPVL
jgi:hypothetical protein